MTHTFKIVFVDLFVCETLNFIQKMSSFNVLQNTIMTQAEFEIQCLNTFENLWVTFAL